MSRWDRLSSLTALLERSQATGEDGGLSQETVEALAALVPSDSIAWFEFRGASSTTTCYREWLDRPGLFAGPSEPAAVAGFWERFWASPFCSFAEQPGHRDAVLVQQDFHPGASWRRTPMYVDVLGRAPVEAEMIVPLAAPRGTSRRLLLVRQVPRDFDEDDRLVLRLLRPHLDAAIGRAARRRLTRRQEAVLRLAAVGVTYDGIARQLGMSPHTARKHLEHAYARLGASGRADAVSRAYPDGVRP